MGSIKEYPGRQRPWRVFISHKGMQQYSRSFVAHEDALRWERQQEKLFDETGLPPTFEQLKKHTVREIVERYISEVTPTKATKDNEELKLKGFLTNYPKLAAKSLA